MTDESVSQLNERMEDYTLVIECSPCDIKKELSMRHFINDYTHPFMSAPNFVCSKCLGTVSREIIKKHTKGVV